MGPLSRFPITVDFRATFILRLNPFVDGQTDANRNNDHRLIVPLMPFESATCRVYLTAPLFHIGKTWDRRSRLASLRHENGRTRAAGHYKMHNS